MIMLDLAILFWFYKEPEISKNHLEILKKNNPNSKIFGLYGGNQNDIGQFRSLNSLLDDLYISPFTDPDWKWMHGDLVLLDWYERRGINFSWESIVITQWDMLIFDSLDNQFSGLKKDEIFLSGFRNLDKTLENHWSWTRENSPHRKDYLAFLQYVKTNYGYSKSTPPCCLFILEVFPRKFFDIYKKVQDKEIGFLEYKIPIYAEIFGIPIYKRDLSVCWTEDHTKFALNARTIGITEKFIREQLAQAQGWRIFHPYFEVWS